MEQVKGESGLEPGEVGTPIINVAEVAKEAAKEIIERKVALDDIFDGVARVVLSREKAEQEGRVPGRTLVVEVPKDGEGGFDLISYGPGEIIDEFDRALDKEKVKHRGIEIDASFTEDPEKIAKLREMAKRQILAANETDRRKALKGLEGTLGVAPLPGAAEQELLAFEGSKEINQGGELSGK